jgi:hypothetical protein
VSTGRRRLTFPSLSPGSNDVGFPTSGGRIAPVPYVGPYASCTRPLRVSLDFPEHLVLCPDRKPWRKRYALPPDVTLCVNYV